MSMDKIMERGERIRLSLIKTISKEHDDRSLTLKQYGLATTMALEALYLSSLAFVIGEKEEWFNVDEHFKELGSKYKAYIAGEMISPDAADILTKAGMRPK